MYPTLDRTLARGAIGVAALSLALAAAGCAARDNPATDDSAATTAAAPQALTVTTTDYAFDMPSQATAGVTTIKLVNHGTTIHHMQLVRLDSAKTVQDLGAAMAREGPPPAWAHFAGGPNAVAPNDSTTATLTLEPGNYAAICVIPAADHELHVAKGMAHPLTVVAAPAGSAPAAEPTTDMSISLSDYAFTLSDSLTAGHHVFDVSNAGTQPHEVVLVRLDAGKTPNDVLTWVFNQNGPPPGVPLGGIVAIEPGMHQSFAADLAPGDYALMCFIPDGKDGKPHAMHGMMKEIHVS
ncbi:MAG TPA: hypothetical protein VFK13_05130 [Gemmatimonadaceae bacterium]|nr:hypothetical protein [Gemmatimonadaceae bacterium]